MAEQFANAGPLTLGTTCGPLNTTLTLAGPGVPNLPTVGTYRLLIDAELVVVSSRTGAVVTVTRAQEGTGAAAHGAGAVVKQVITAGALLQLKADASDGGGGGGGTITAGSFTRPNLNESVEVPVGDTTVLAKGQYATVDDGALSYIVSDIAGSLVTFFNGAETNPTGGTVLAGATVALGGAGPQVDDGVVKAGQVYAVDPVSKKWSAVGHAPVNHIASFGGNPSSTTNAKAVEDMFAACASNRRPAFIDKNTYQTERPACCPYEGVILRAEAVASSTYHLRSYGNWTGPVVIMGITTDPVAWHQDTATGEWMLPLAAPSPTQLDWGINLSEIDACSVDGCPLFGFDVNWKPAATHVDGQYPIAGCAGGSIGAATPPVCFSLTYYAISNVLTVQLVFSTVNNHNVTIVSTLSGGMTPNAVNHISATYDGTTVKLIVRNSTTVKTDSSAATGAVLQDKYQRFFVGAYPGPYLQGGTVCTGGPFASAKGDYLGSYRLSLGGIYITSPNALTPATAGIMLADNSHTVVLPEGFTSFPTAAVGNFAPRAASSGIGIGRGSDPENGVVAGYAVVECNVTRRAISGRTTGYVAWVPMGGQDLPFTGKQTVEHLAVYAIGTCMHSWTCPDMVLRGVSFTGDKGFTADNFSYFTRSEDSLYISTGGGATLCYDAWGLGLVSEGCVSNTDKTGGGLWGLVMSGGMVLDVYGSNGSSGALLMNGNGGRSGEVIGYHLYNESGTATEGLMRSLDMVTCTVEGGTTGTIFSPNAAQIQIDGGREFIVLGAWYASSLYVFSFVHQPLAPPKVLGCVADATDGWVDPANPGQLDFVNEVVRSVVTTTDANYALSDVLFWGAKCLKFADDGTHHWTAPHTMTLPYAYEGMVRRIENYEATTMTVHPGTQTIASNSHLVLRADGTNWVLP